MKNYLLIFLLAAITNLSYSQCPTTLNYTPNAKSDITVYIIDINQNIIDSITCQTNGNGNGNTAHIKCDSLELYEYFMFINHKDTCIYGYGGHPITNLPVELLYFEPIVKDGTVVLNWATGSETNNDYFTIERSLDGYNWDSILSISGQGNIAEQTTYKLYDRAFGLSGIVYYRLSQTDYDGKREVFDIKSCFIHKRKVVKIINTLGQKVDINYKGLKIIIYNNGDRIKTY